MMRGRSWRRPRKHFDSVRSDIEAFEQRDNHTISCEINADEAKYTSYVHDFETPGQDWGLRIGDCLHNARAALDCVVVRLFAIVSGQRPDSSRGGGMNVNGSV
jgi:hypothetical protein